MSEEQSNLIPEVSTPDLTEQPPSSASPHESKLWRDVAETLLLTAIVFLVVNTLIGRFRIEQVSMLPNLHDGEYVIVDKVSYVLHHPQRGDIVVLKRVGQPDLIKRVIGLPGETLEIHDGQVFINSAPLTEPYINGPIADAFSAQQVPADHYFVMGDNRNNSEDSRRLGAFPQSDIVGRAWIIYWPPTDWQILHAPTYALAQSP